MHILKIHFSYIVVVIRLQTGMRGAFGKPQGTVARVDIGQIILSVRAKDAHKDKVVEALRRAKFKFPGRQKVEKFRVTSCNIVGLIICCSLLLK